MFARTSTLLFLAAIAFIFAPAVHSFYSYDNDFIDPQLILARNFSNVTLLAQQTILAWADETATLGPWSVTNKTIVPPSGDKHDYMSWAPYFWPDCSKVGNTTALTPEEIWTTCPYVDRDGQFNPDVRTSGLNDIGNFGDLSDAVLYNSLAWAINGSSVYSANVARFIDTWFINPDTGMNPNLNYAQMERGPTGQIGTHTGLLDLKSVAKIVPSVLILRDGKAPEWTAALDAGFVNWTNSYLPWLQTAKIAVEEEDSLNNHGSFYFNQLASLQILVGNMSGANQTIQKYFTGIYKGQIATNGDQPFESVRTHPYHYRAYNLAAMITNGRIAEFLAYDAWNLTTKSGATIKDACDFAMAQAPGSEPPDEIYALVNAIGSIYGDPNGTYAKWLFSHSGNYSSDASFLWNQPFADLVTVNTTSSNSTGSSNNKQNGASLGADISMALWAAGSLTSATVMALSLFKFL